MISKTVLAVAFAWIAFGSTPAIARESIVETLSWDVSVSAQGTVEKLMRVGKGSDALREQLEAAIKDWRFGAGLADGKPVASSTSIEVIVKLDPAVDKGRSVTIMSASTGGRFDSGRPPKYPIPAIRAGREGLVVVEASYDIDGKVTDAIPYSYSPLTEGDLVDSALNTVRKFRYKPETVGSNAVAGKFFRPCVSP